MTVAKPNNIEKPKFFLFTNWCTSELS